LEKEISNETIQVYFKEFDPCRNKNPTYKLRNENAENNDNFSPNRTLNSSSQTLNAFQGSAAYFVPVLQVLCFVLHVISLVLEPSSLFLKQDLVTGNIL